MTREDKLYKKWLKTIIKRSDEIGLIRIDDFREEEMMIVTDFEKDDIMKSYFENLKKHIVQATKEALADIKYKNK